MPIPAPQQHRAYELIRAKDLSACLTYLQALRLPKKLAKAVQDIDCRYQKQCAATNYHNVAQRQRLALEEDVFLQELEALLGQKHRPVWVIGWEAYKDTMMAYLPQGVLGLVVIIGMGWYVQSTTPQELTIQVRDGNDAPALVGKARVTVTSNSHRSFSREIEKDGIVDFSNLSLKEFNDSITLGLSFNAVEDEKLWAAVGPKRFLYQGEALTLLVDKTKIWGWIRGQVTNFRTGDPLAGAYIQVADCSKVVHYSDSLGNFDVVLPRECWKKDLHVGYRVRVHLAGYVSDVVPNYHPLSSALDFRLTPK